jgi:hypothetical protein
VIDRRGVTLSAGAAAFHEALTDEGVDGLRRRLDEEG